MPNEQLLSYIRGELAEGADKAQIMQSLVSNGWNSGDLEDVFTSLGSAPATPTPSLPHIPRPAYDAEEEFETVKYAGFWLRLAASSIDGVVILALQLIATLMLPSGLLRYIIPTLFGWVYVISMLTNYEATLGKMAVGLRVERSNGDRISFERACLREIVGKPLSFITLLIGFLMVAWTARKQGLHDIIADTVVIEKEPEKSKTGWVVLGAFFFALLLALPLLAVVSSIGLASLNVAREKGHDAAIKADLATVQAQAELYYGSTGANSYGAPSTDCSSGVFSDPTVARALTDAKTANGGTDLSCNKSSTAYAVASTLATDSSKYWCVDSTGVSAEILYQLPSGQTSCSPETPSL